VGIGESGEAESKEAAATDLALYKWQSGRNHSPVAFSATMPPPPLPSKFKNHRGFPSWNSTMDQARLANVMSAAPPRGIDSDRGDCCCVGLRWDPCESNKGISLKAGLPPILGMCDPLLGGGRACDGGIEEDMDGVHGSVEEEGPRGSGKMSLDIAFQLLGWGQDDWPTPQEVGIFCLINSPHDFSRGLGRRRASSRSFTV